MVRDRRTNIRVSRSIGRPHRSFPERRSKACLEVGATHAQDGSMAEQQLDLFPHRSVEMGRDLSHSTYHALLAAEIDDGRSRRFRARPSAVAASSSPKPGGDDWPRPCRRLPRCAAALRALALTARSRSPRADRGGDCSALPTELSLVSVSDPRIRSRHCQTPPPGVFFSWV
jgi:hypothetical protein